MCDNTWPNSKFAWSKRFIENKNTIKLNESARDWQIKQEFLDFLWIKGQKIRPRKCQCNLRVQRKVWPFEVRLLPLSSKWKRFLLVWIKCAIIVWSTF